MGKGERRKMRVTYKNYEGILLNYERKNENEALVYILLDDDVVIRVECKKGEVHEVKEDD